MKKQIMADAELNPCPFCGGEAEIKPNNIYTEKGLCVRCKNCNVHTKTILYECTYNQYDEKVNVYVTKEMAVEQLIKMWNRRVNNG